jgi:outer membrane protein TolC
MRKKSLTYTASILLFLFLTGDRGSAQSVFLNTVHDAIEYAFKHNPDLEIYKLNKSKAEYDYKSVKNYRWPTISASFSGVNNISLPVTKIPGEIFGQQGKTIEAEFGQQYDYVTGINISKNILDFQSKFTAKVAKVNVEIAEANKDAYKQKLAEQIALYYYTAIITNKALKVQETDYKTADDVIKIVDQKFDQGIVDQITVNLARMNKFSIKQNIDTYRIILEQCNSNLKILFGVDSETDIVFNEKLKSDESIIPSIDFIAPDKSLEVLKLQLKQADYKVSQQRSNWYPKLSLNKYFGAQQYRDNFGISFDNNDWSKTSYISLNISIPIFTGFATKNKINSALIEYDISQNTLKQEMLKSKIEDESIRKEFNHSKEAVDAAKDSYLLAKVNADLQFQKFEQGIVSLDKYLDFFDDYLKTEVTYLNLLSDSYNYYSKMLARNF